MAPEEPIELADQTPDADPGAKEPPKPSSADAVAVHGIERVWATTYAPHRRPEDD